MDTRASENRKIILASEEQAQSTRMFEAFLEAAPQFILQLTIILQTGDYGNFLQKIQNDLLSCLFCSPVLPGFKFSVAGAICPV